MNAGKWLSCAVVMVGMCSRALPAQQTSAAVDSQGLKSLSLEQLGSLKITSVAKQPEEIWNTAAAVSVLTQDDIRRSGATSIPELLRLVPGVEVARTQSNSWAVAIRGFNSSFSRDVLVLIDGRSVYTPLFEGVYWDVQDLPFEEIERIEVIRGPGATIWGANAVNGVINIITKHSRDTQGPMAYVSGGGPVEKIVDEFGYGASPLPGVQFRVWAKEFNRGAEKNPGNDPYDVSAQKRGGFRVDWQPTKKDDVALSGAFYNGKTNDVNTLTTFTPAAAAVVHGTQATIGGDLVLRWDRKQTENVSFYVEGYWDHTNRKTTQFQETRNTFDADLVSHVANFYGQDFTFGVGLRESPSDTPQTQAGVLFMPTHFDNYLFSFFGQDSIKLLDDKVTLSLGAKLIKNPYTGWGVQPSAQVLYRPRASTSVWGSVARALRTPGRVDRDLQYFEFVKATPATFVLLEGNPNFKDEVEIGWGVGARQLLAKKLFVDVSAFHNQYDNLESYGGPATGLAFPTSPYPFTEQVMQFGNGIRGVTDGLEIAPDFKPVSWMELRGSFSHTHIGLHSKKGYAQQSTISSIEGSSPDHQVKMDAIFSGGGWEVTPDYRYVSRLPGQNVESYQTMDLRVGYRMLHQKLEAAVDGRNLLQPHHHEFLGDNGNPVGIQREVYGSLGYSW